MSGIIRRECSSLCFIQFMILARDLARISLVLIRSQVINPSIDPSRPRKTVLKWHVYLSSATPPFRMLSISSTPIVDNSLYTGKDRLSLTLVATSFLKAFLFSSSFVQGNGILIMDCALITCRIP